jgi:hypothetical protein
MQDNDGERELVLGNKQLLTIFFAATLLCGVFFAVGYVVGGNSAKSGSGTTAATTDSTTTSTDGKREEPTAPTSDTASPTTVVSSTADPAGLPSSEPQIRENPSSSTPAPSTPAPPPVAAAPAPQPVKIPPSSATSSSGVFISVPEQGASYVQVSATSRPSADSLVKILREANMPAILVGSSKPDLFEVLVGPYRTPLTFADAKRKLTDLGYNGTISRKF